MKISGGLVLKPNGGWSREDVSIENGRFSETENSGETINAGGLYALPGFVDLHTHGAVGVDVNGADENGFRKISSFFATQGVTSWQCSILTDTVETTLETISEAVKVIESEPDGAKLIGIHLEGPCLSSEYKGAMPEQLLMKKADIGLFEKYIEAANGHITYVTLSPEIEGADELTSWLTSRGIRVALGHSGATYEETIRCINAGAVSGTHVGNAMRLFHQHEPAIFGAILESDAYCEAICDGRHLSPASVRLFRKTKGDGKMIAITDSIMAAGMPDGKYKLGVNDVIVENGDTKLMDGTRAGSTLTMAGALKNIIKFTGIPLENAARWLSKNPADMMGRKDLGRIKSGACADLAILDKNLNVICTVAGGRVVYQK
ncbi:MAG: N-acetylglucosamine-6-phosphate deacetylase [Oscillospiraceae bacterium]|nr:N-acetylglucosamine-6-phosphate deacetylase [Oscillospiraceae bacterium]